MNLAEHPVVCFGNQILLGTFHNPLFLGRVTRRNSLANSFPPPPFSIAFSPGFPCDEGDETRGEGGERRAIGCLASPFIPKFGIGTTFYFEGPSWKYDGTFPKTPTPKPIPNWPVKATVE
jgi:hypothetical protein